MLKLFKGFLFLFFLVSVYNSYGQAGSSPFTSRGIGDIYGSELAHNRAMGGIGISNGSFWNLNNLNPALLPYNSLTVFSAGFIGENRTVDNSTSSESNSQGNLNYLATAFPLKPGKWTTSLGLMPYSNVNYNFSFEQQVGNSTESVQIREEGSGGLSQLYWSNGFAINRNIFVGLKGSYLFSSIESNFSNVLLGNASINSFSPNVKERISASDFMLGSGIAFKKDSIFNNKIQLNIGATYDFAADVNTKKFQTIERVSPFGQIVDQDTLADNTRGSMKIPMALGFGVSLSNGQKWTVGLDIKHQKWSNYENFEGSNENLADYTKIGLGAEWIPDGGSIDKYFKRISYRFGLNFENSPYNITNDLGQTSQVQDLGINFGWSLPVSRLSSIDMAFSFGQRGDITDTLLKEQYFKFYLGVTWNDNKWFIQRKFN